MLLRCAHFARLESMFNYINYVAPLFGHSFFDSLCIYVAYAMCSLLYSYRLTVDFYICY